MVKTKNEARELERRQHIILTARRLLAEGSHADVSLARIAEEAGVSKGMLTYYYATKDELITETIEHHLAMQEQLIMLVAHDTNLSVRERLEHVLLYALPDGPHAAEQLCFIVEVWSYAKTRPEVMDMVRGAYTRFREHGERLLAIGASEGYVTAKDHAWINIALNALMDGLSFQLAVDDTLDAADVRKRVLALVDHMVSA